MYMISLADIHAAETRIFPHIIHTPLVHSPTLSDLTGAHVYLKLETLQKAGSFKVRGATNKILSHATTRRTSGVVAASAGNHAQGVAVAARSAGIPATIVMPEWSTLSKQEATRSYGAQVLIHGLTLEESIEKAKEIARKGIVFIHPYDDDAVIAGQGTIGLEILRDLPATDMIVVPVGGGGLIAGIAIAAKGMKPDVTIIGARSSMCPSAGEVLHNGCSVQTQGQKTIADGIRVAEPGTRTLPVIRKYVDRHVLASEEEIADAMLLLLERKHVVAEGAGAVPLAVILNESIDIPSGSNVVLVISGGNVESTLLFRVIRQSLVRQGRITRFSILLDDRPGTLACILTLITRERGNIIQINHMEGERDTPLQMARVNIELETRGWDHVRDIRKVLTDEGYEIRME